MIEKRLTGSDIRASLRNQKAILRKFGVVRIGLFGSYARGDQKISSDIDFLVEFERPDFDNFMNLVFFLEDLFGKRVEVITNGNISPYLRPFIEKEVQWYETEPSVS